MHCAFLSITVLSANFVCYAENYGAGRLTLRVLWCSAVILLVCLVVVSCLYQLQDLAGFCVPATRSCGFIVFAHLFPSVFFFQSLLFIARLCLIIWANRSIHFVVCWSAPTLGTGGFCVSLFMGGEGIFFGSDWS